MIPTYKILLGDAMHTGLPDKSVDLVVHSSPYESQRLYAELGFNLRSEDFVRWMFKGCMEWLRVCRGPVVMVLEGRTEDFRWSATPALLMADLHRAGVTLRKPPAFYRVGIPGSGGPDYFRNDYEFCIVATSGGKMPWSDNTAMGHPPKWAPGGAMSHRLSDGTRRNQWGRSPNTPVNSRKRNGERDQHLKPSNREVPTKRERFIITRPRPGMHNQETPYSPPVLANPGNMIQQKYSAEEVAAMFPQQGDVLKCNVGGGLMGHPLSHENEAPFPESLVEFFVRSFCPPGGTVADFFCGSGTTGAVALKHGRNFIGIDKRFSQVKIATRRLREVAQSLQTAGAA